MSIVDGTCNYFARRAGTYIEISTTQDSAPQPLSTLQHLHSAWKEYSSEISTPLELNVHVDISSSLQEGFDGGHVGSSPWKREVYYPGGLCRYIVPTE